MVLKKQPSDRKPEAGSVIKEEDTAPPFLTVAIGASAGGHAPLEQIFTLLPADCRLCFVVIMHLPAEGPSLLADILSSHTSLQVVTVEDGMMLQSSTIHVAPPGKDLTMDGGRLRLVTREAERIPHPIDRFFSSLAADLGRSAIAVILSGFGSDGAEGVKRIKEEGGRVLIQDPETAINPFMPQNAIATGMADSILAAAEIADRLVRIAREEKNFPTEIFPAPRDEELRPLFAILKARTSHDFSSYKRNTVLRRIERRMAANGATALADYHAILEKNPGEAQALCQELLIGVTRFFRDPDAFELLRSKIIPTLFANRDRKEPVRIWHACCATGEEAYSVAMLILEHLDRENLQTKVQIFATDLDETAVARARAGLYADDIVPEEERRTRFFTKRENGWQVTKQLREMIVFAHHNLINDPPFSRLDLLVCRNFLIYLKPEIQRLLIPLFHQVLNPKGYLFLGSAETVGLHGDLFTPVDKQWKIFRRQGGKSRVDPLFPFSGSVRKLTDIERSVVSTQTRETAMVALADKLLMERYVPARMIINEKNEVIYFSKQAGAYLLTPEGKPTQDLLRIAREELRPALRAAIYKAFTHQKENEYRGIKVATGHGETTINIIVVPLEESPPAGKLALVIIEPAAAASFSDISSEAAGPGNDACRNSLTRHLEEQLRVTSEQLQSTSEQLETSNERFTLANEELMTVNEELQSTNEELQSTNEELVTINSELQKKMEELNQSNSDLENLFASSEIATFFLDRELVIKRFSPAMAALFNLTPADIGRSVHHLNNSINWSELPLDAASVLDTLVPVEREVSFSQNGRSFIMRVLPYRTNRGMIDGIVVTLIDISERKRAEKAVNQASEQRRLALEGAELGSWDYRFETDQFFWDQRCREIWGGTEGDLFDYTAVIDRIHPEHRTAVDKAVGQALSGADEGAYHQEYRVVWPDNSEHWIASHGRAYWEGGPRPVRFVGVSRDITEIKRKEEALRRSEAQYHTLFDTLIEGFCTIELIFDPEDRPVDYRLLETNPAFENLTGLHNAKGKLIRELAPGNEQHWYERYGKVALTGEPVRFEGEAKALGRCFDVCAYRIGDPHDRKVAILFNDITERKQAEEALRESAARLKRSQEIAHLGSWELDLLKNELTWSDETYRIFGFQPQEFKAGYEAFLQAVHPEDRSMVDSAYSNSLRKGKDSYEVEHRIVKKTTGEIRIVHEKCEHFRDASARVVRSVGMVHDITERKRAEETLRLSEQRRSLALEAAQAGTWEWDLLTNENIWSKELWSLYGLAENSCTPSYEQWRKIVHPDDLAPTEQILQEAILRGTAYNTEWRVNLPDGGERWLMSRGKPLTDEHHRVVRYLGIVIDITERKRTGKEKKTMEAQLIQAQKMEAIGTLAAGIAHDFNNILGAILGYTEMAREASPAGSAIAQDLDKVLEAGGRATNLVKQILAFSRQVIPERIALEPAHLIREALKLLRPALPSTITIKQQLDTATGAILADPTQMHQIVINLCTNAFHAMEQTGGVLEITLTDCEICPSEHLKHPGLQPGKFVLLSISDTGPGVPQAIRDKIFEPYFTTKEAGKGTGMGLSIVHGIISAMGGVIIYEGEPGEGATFHAYFPAMEREVAALTMPVETVCAGHERVLYIDDEEMLAEMGEIMLERLGYKVTVRTSSLEALTTFQNQPDQFDVVITDQTMPGLTGVELSRRMLRIRPEIPIILCTGYSNLVNEEQAKALGIKGFIMKPMTKREIAQLLREVLDTGSL
jgi:two-component system, chemotaxis family, CheB/CheR fusion protein